MFLVSKPENNILFIWSCVPCEVGCVLYIYNPVSLIFDTGPDFCICFSRKELLVSHALKKNHKKNRKWKKVLWVLIYILMFYL